MTIGIYVSTSSHHHVQVADSDSASRNVKPMMLSSATLVACFMKDGTTANCRMGCFVQTKLRTYVGKHPAVLEIENVMSGTLNNSNCY